MVSLSTPTKWDREAFWGSDDAVGYALRDLPHLDRAIASTVGRNVTVQAGANLGIFPKRLAEAFAAVYAFEPVPQWMRWAQRNAPEPNIHYFQEAIGDSDARVGVSLARQDDKDTAPHEGVAHIQGAGPVLQRTLDDLARKLTECDLLVLDLEGYEYRALTAGTRFLALFRPVLLVEVTDRYLQRQGGTDAQLREFLTAHGYTCLERMRSDELWIPRVRQAA